jgi:hypothetical protein
VRARVREREREVSKVWVFEAGFSPNLSTVYGVFGRTMWHRLGDVSAFFLLDLIKLWDLLFRIVVASTTESWRKDRLK